MARHDSPWLDAIILRALALRPDDRFAAYSEMRFQLEHPEKVKPFRSAGAPLLEAIRHSYAGSFVGENIYFYASPRRSGAAFDAWWQSDGHRFVMFDPKSEQIGLSNTPATHWTMMTGVAPAREEIREARLDR